MTRFTGKVLAAATSALALAFAVPAQAQLSNGNTSGQGSATVVELGGAHFVGNPEAELTLTEYVSYTCPHCAQFATDGDAALKLAYIPSGKLRVEYQTFLRNPVDVAASLLARCGDSWRFPANHHALMFNQPEWLRKAQKATPSQTQRWGTGPMSDRMRAIAGDLGLYAIMEAQGYQRTELDQCLADEAAIGVFVAQTQAAIENGVTGTPSFALNGELLADVHAWQPLQPLLDTALGVGAVTETP